MDGVDEVVLAKMPLAEAILTVWRLIADEDRLQAIFDRYRGRCYEQSISFATMVQLVADALLEHEGSGNQSFARAYESGDLELGCSPMDLGTLPMIPSKENEDRSARPFEFAREAYRDRNIVERLIGWLKESRRIFSRFEKTASNYAGMIKMAFIRQFLRYDILF